MDPVAAFQSHLNAVGAFAAQHAASEAATLLTLLYQVAFDPVADSAALRRVDDALANRVFEIGVPPGLRGGLRTSGAARALDATPGAEPTIYVYINGIWSTRSNAAATYAILKDMIDRSMELANGQQSVRYFYNRTRLATPESPERTRARCIAQLELFARVLTPAQWQAAVDACVGQPSPVPLTEEDLLESYRQLLAITNQSTFFPEDVESLANTIDAWRKAGSHVIVVGHSQGNLVLIQAANRLYTRGDLDFSRDSVGLGAVTLASPTDYGFPPPLDQLHVRHIVVRGDVVPSLGGVAGIPNSATPTETPLSLQFDAELSRAAESVAFGVMLYVYTRAKWIPRMHSVNEAYLGQQVISDLLMQDLVDIKREVTLGRVRTVGFLQPTTGQTADANPIFEVLNQNDRPLYGHHRTWTSSDLGVLAVTPDGIVTAVSPGSATLTMAVKGFSASLLVTVSEPSPFPGLYVFGTWDGQVSFQAGETCTASLTILFDGRMTLTCPISGVSSLFWPMREFPPNYTHVILRQTAFQEMDLSLVGDGNTLAGTWVWYPCCYPVGIPVSFTRRR